MVAALAVVASTLPNLSASFWTSAIDVPPFFSDALYAKFLAPGETVVVLPYGINGNSMLWQLQSGWYFRMAGGYAGNPPLEFRQWPIVRVFYRVGTVALPAAGDQLKAFLATHRATAVLVDDREAEIWRPLMATLDAPPIEAGGMTIYRVGARGTRSMAERDRTCDGDAPGPSALRGARARGRELPARRPSAGRA